MSTSEDWKRFRREQLKMPLSAAEIISQQTPKATIMIKKKSNDGLIQLINKALNEIEILTTYVTIEEQVTLAEQNGFPDVKKVLEKFK